MATCANCGYELTDDMDFCPECGCPVNGEVNETSEEFDFDDDSPWYERDIFHAALSPLVNSFDNGKFYLIAATVIIDVLVTGFLLSQPIEAYYLFDSHALKRLSVADKTAELVFAIVWLLIAIFSFGYWMKRIVRMKNLFNQNDEFVVIPIGTYLLQWLGEWIAIILTIGGIFAIIISLVDIHTSSLMLSIVTYYGCTGGIIAIIVGICIIFIFRLTAEKIRALASIANNTSKQHNVEPLYNIEEDTNDTYYNIFYIICIVATLVFMILAMNQ